jgi:hypothetical protein
MNHLVSYSGGACSFLAAKRVIEKNGGPQNVTLLFADTKMEDEDLYRFMRETGEYLGVPVTTISDGRTPWQVFHDKKFLGNTRADPCSQVLKRDLLWKWTAANFKPEDTTVYVGLDWQEEHRLVRLREARPGWNIQAPMAERPLMDKGMMLKELKRIGIEIPRLYKLGFPHNNCGGFCVKAGQAHFAHLLAVMPERYAYHENQEQELRKVIGPHAILRDRSGGTTKPMTLRDFRLRIEGKKEVDREDWGGCGCAIG